MTSLLSGSLRVALVLVFLTPLAVSFSPLPATAFPYVFPKSPFSWILVEVAFGLWILAMRRDPSVRPRFSWVMAAVAVYLAIQLAAGLAGVAPGRSLWSGFERMTGWVHWAHFFVWALMLGSVFRNWRDWRFPLSCAAGVSLVLGLLAFFAQGGWISWLEPFGPVEGRAAATFGNPAFAGGYAAVAFYCSLGLVGVSAMRFFRSGGAPSGSGLREEAGFALLWLVGAGLMLMLLWWSGTRGALLGFAAGALVFSSGCFLWPPGRFWRAGGAVVAALLAAGGLFLAVSLVSGGDAAHSLRDGLRQDRPESVPERRMLAEAAWRGFLDRPLLGWGDGNFNLVFELHAPRDASVDGFVRFDRAHSMPLDQLVSGGIAGFSAWALMWFALGFCLVRAVRGFSGRRRAIALCMGAALAGHFGQNLFLFDTPGVFPQFFLLVAFVSFCELQMGVVRPSWLRVPGFLRARVVVRAPSSFGSALVAVAVLAAMASVYYVGFRSWAAGTAVLPMFNLDGSYRESREALDRVADLFPPLSGEAALWFGQGVSARWDYLSDDERRDALEAADRRLRPALEADPFNHRLAVVAAGVYQRAGAGAGSPARLAEAGELLRRAEALAPYWFDVRATAAVQAALERGPGAGAAEIERYLAEVPSAALRLDDLHYDLTYAAALGLEFGGSWGVVE